MTSAEKLSCKGHSNLRSIQLKSISVHIQIDLDTSHQRQRPLCYRNKRSVLRRLVVRYKSKYKKFGVLPIRKAKSNVSSVSPSLERNMFSLYTMATWADHIPQRHYEHKQPHQGGNMKISTYY